jgi:hypothetical protein
MEREELLRAGSHGEAGGGGDSRSLHMLLEAYLAIGADLEPGHRGKIDELLARFTVGKLSEGTLVRVAEYQELSGRFAKAEDAHWALLERGPWQAGGLVGFYERLLKRSDAELESGDLPRTEVLEGLAEARARSPDPEEG